MLKDLPEEFQGPMAWLLTIANPELGYFAIGKSKIPTAFLTRMREEEGLVRDQGDSMLAVTGSWRHYLVDKQRKSELKVILSSPDVHEQLAQLAKESTEDLAEARRRYRKHSRMPKLD